MCIALLARDTDRLYDLYNIDLNDNAQTPLGRFVVDILYVQPHL